MIAFWSLLTGLAALVLLIYNERKAARLDERNKIQSQELTLNSQKEEDIRKKRAEIKKESAADAENLPSDWPDSGVIKLRRPKTHSSTTPDDAA